MYGTPGHPSSIRRGEEVPSKGLNSFLLATSPHPKLRAFALPLQSKASCNRKAMPSATSDRYKVLEEVGPSPGGKFTLVIPNL